MKRLTDFLFAVGWGAFGGVLVTGVGLVALLFIAFGLSAGVFSALIEEAFLKLFGSQWLLIVLALGALIGATRSGYSFLRHRFNDLP